MPLPIRNESPSLADLQDWLRWIFTEPNGIDGALNPGPSQARRLLRRAEPAPRLIHLINDGHPIGAPRRLAVYSDAYFLRLLESLGSDFQAVRRSIGDELFRGLIADYLAETPSTSKNISDLSEKLPAFLMRHKLSRRFPFLLDLARLEWAVLRCLYTDRLPPLNLISLKEIPPEAWPQAKLIADPTVALIDLEWPVDNLWRRRGLSASRGGRRLSRPRPQRLLLYRDDEWVQMRPLDPLEGLALEMLAAGRTLGDICSRIEDALPHDANRLDIQSLFSAWVTQGVIKRVEVSGTQR